MAQVPMAVTSEAGVAFEFPLGDGWCALSLCLSWQRPGFSESTEQVSTGLGVNWKLRGGGDTCVAWNVDLEGNQGFQKCRLSHPEAAGSAGLQLQRP